MKRALLVSAGTVLGLYGTLSYSPGMANPAPTLALGLGGSTATDGTATPSSTASSTAAASSSATPTPSKTNSASPVPSGSNTSAKPKPSKTSKKPSPTTSASATATASATPTGPQDGDFTGSSERVARYGTLQVQIRVAGGVITDVGVTKYPNTHRESIDINTAALPVLYASALSAQSADIAAISGATDTVEAFKRSLRAAMTLAGL